MEPRQNRLAPEVVAAIVGAIAAVVVAVITALATIYVASGNLNRASERAEKLTQGVLGVQVPVGTIIPSGLTPEAFRQVAGDEFNCDPTRCLWVLADGREVPGSEFAKISGKQVVPDLRGLFLRGANLGRSDAWKDPEDREPGASPQPDSTAMPKTPWTTAAAGEHTHNIPSTGDENGFHRAEEGGNQDRTIGTSAAGVHTHAIDGGDNETRPKNAAVAYYIKINTGAPAAP